MFYIDLFITKLVLKLTLNFDQLDHNFNVTIFTYIINKPYINDVILIPILLIL